MKKTQNTTAISLKLLAGDKEHYTGVSRNESFRVNPATITFEPGFNLRPEVADTKDPLAAHLERLKIAETDGTPLDAIDAHIDRLYQAMKNGAHVPPLDVRVDAGKIICVDGHCRTVAGRRLKMEVDDFTLEARQFRGNEQERVLHMLGTGSGQKPLTPLEQGLGYLRLVKYGMTVPDIATKLGVSRVTVDNGLVLAEASPEVQKLVKTGVVSSTTAREAIKQGAEGVEALKTAAANAATAPAETTKSGKKSTKKKVTAKKLKGTAADKKTNPKKGKTAATKADKLAASNNAPALVDGEIMVKVKKAGAQKVVDFLKGNAPDSDPELNEFIATLEMVLL